MMCIVKGKRRALIANHRHRGTAIMTCMVLLGFAGIAVAAMATHIAADAGRTRHNIADAQIRQLLTFAAIDLQQRLPVNDDDAIEEPVEFALPADLVTNPSSAATVTASRQPSAADQVRYKITAMMGTRGHAQVVTFAKSGNAWKLIAATLDRRAW